MLKKTRIKNNNIRSENGRALLETEVGKEHTYFVKGMHCASCEILIEKRLSAIKEIKSVELVLIKINDKYTIMVNEKSG